MTKMNLSDFKTLPMELRPDEIASLLSHLLDLDPPANEGVKLIGELHDRQQLHWKPFDASSLGAIDAWLAKAWSDELEFVDRAATLVVSLDLPLALRCLQATADRSDDAAVAHLAREALAEL